MRFLSLIGLLALGGSLMADEKLKGIACRSVHLGYPAPKGVAFYTEATVRQSAPGTYFMTCGWSKGYFGIQELANGKKLLIFSVWDPTAGDDPKRVPAERRVQLLHNHPDVRVGRFGNEGTGGQSFYDYNWKVGTSYRFMISARPEGKTRAAYTGYFFHPEKKEWLKLVTFSTESQELLSGYYSFIEDFRRNRISASQVRRAEFTNGWVKPIEGDWVPLTKARFTGDSNPVLNIDAGLQKNDFFLATGGNTENKTTKLRQTLERASLPRERPTDLPKLEE